MLRELLVSFVLASAAFAQPVLHATRIGDPCGGATGWPRLQPNWVGYLFSRAGCGQFSQEECRPRSVIVVGIRRYAEPIRLPMMLEVASGCTWYVEPLLASTNPDAVFRVADVRVPMTLYMQGAHRCCFGTPLWGLSEAWEIRIRP